MYNTKSLLLYQLCNNQLINFFIKHKTMKNLRLKSEQNAIVGRTISLEEFNSQLSSNSSNMLAYNKNKVIQKRL